jgi:hypothetical protein
MILFFTSLPLFLIIHPHFHFPLLSVQNSFFLYIFWGIFSFSFVLYSALLHLPPLRFHCSDGCWDRTQDRCNWQSDALTTRLDLIQNSISVSKPPSLCSPFCSPPPPPLATPPHSLRLSEIVSQLMTLVMVNGGGGGTGYIFLCGGGWGGRG